MYTLGRPKSLMSTFPEQPFTQFILGSTKPGYRKVLMLFSCPHMPVLYPIERTKLSSLVFTARGEDASRR